MTYSGVPLMLLAWLLLAPSSWAERVWLDADAGCIGAAQTDPDDCLALYALVSGGADLAGISSVAGNVTESVSAETLAALGTAFRQSGWSVSAPVRGANAASAICAAAHAGNLTILASGPLTNVAAAVGLCPENLAAVDRIILVGGKKAGDVFHPAEDRMAEARFGHGPIFRDMNVALDPAAVKQVLTSGVPVQLVTYEAARDVELTSAILDTLEQQDSVGTFIARRARAWLDWWQTDIGRDGFYPFDLVAAAAILAPDALACAPVNVRVARDWKVGRVWGPMSLLIEPATGNSGNVTACRAIAPGGGRRILGLVAHHLETHFDG